MLVNWNGLWAYMIGKVYCTSFLYKLPITKFLGMTCRCMNIVLNIWWVSKNIIWVLRITQCEDSDWLELSERHIEQQMQILLMQLKITWWAHPKGFHISGSLENGKAALLPLVISCMFEKQPLQLYYNPFSSIGVGSASIHIPGPGRGLAQ